MPTPVTSDHSTRSGGKAGQQCSSAAIIVASETPKDTSQSPNPTPEPSTANKEGDNVTLIEKSTNAPPRLGGIVCDLSKMIELLRPISVYGKWSSDKDKVLDGLKRAIQDLEAIDIDTQTQLTSKFETKLNNIMDKITAMERKSRTELTYSQAVQIGLEHQQDTAKAQEIRQRNIQARQRQRTEAEKYEVTLTVEHANDTIKKSIAGATHEEIVRQLQATINRTTQIEPKPTIQGIQKLKSGDIRVKCSTPNDANELKNKEWSSAYEGMEVKKPRYGIVIHRVPTEYINFDNRNMTETIQHMEQQNQSKGLKILSIVPLRKKPENPQSNPEKQPAHQSIIVFTYDADSADACIKQGTNIKWGTYRTEKYAPQLRLTQCYNCQKFGHTARSCRNQLTCGKCGSHDHSTSNCTSESHQCPACQGNHPSWHPQCPHRMEEANKIMDKRRSTSPYFNSVHE